MCKSVMVWNVMCKFMRVQKYRVMGKYWGGGGGGGYGSIRCKYGSG